MKQIYLYDPNPFFAEKIQKHLNQLLHPIAVIMLLSSDASIDKKIDLLIIHESYRNTFKEKLNQIGKERVFWLTEATNKQESTISRKAQLQEWHHFILFALESLKRVKKENKLHLVFTFDCEIRIVFFQKWLLKQKRKGKKIFIFPFKPLYFWNYRASFHGGPDLSDFILQAEEDLPLTHKDLGLIFEKQKDGYFLPRPSKSSDDIYNYKIMTIQKISALFRDFLYEHSEDSIGLIDIEARPFSLVKDVSSLVDICHIDFTKKNDFGSEKAKQEIADFLAHKPASVSVKPISLQSLEEE